MVNHILFIRNAQIIFSTRSDMYVDTESCRLELFSAGSVWHYQNLFTFYDFSSIFFMQFCSLLSFFGSFRSFIFTSSILYHSNNSEVTLFFCCFTRFCSRCVCRLSGYQHFLLMLSKAPYYLCSIFKVDIIEYLRSFWSLF